MKAVSGAVVLVTFLTSIPTCTQTPAPVQLGLNHFWAVLDDTTAEAVKNSAVLPEFAHFTVQTVAPGDGRKWTGRYLTGEQTYVELFAVRDIEEPGMPAVVGSVVIGLGTDNIGGLRDLDARLRSSGLKPEMGMQKARIGGRDVDWFNTVNIRSETDAFGIFAMEYTTAFFDAVKNRRASEGPTDLISRKRYNSKDYRHQLMRDIAEVEIGVYRFRFKRSGQADTNGNHRQLGPDDRLGQWGAVGVQRTIGELHTASRESLTRVAVHARQILSL